MIKTIATLLMTILIGACSYTDSNNNIYTYLKDKILDKPLLIGYQTITPKENIPHDLIVEFDSNEYRLSPDDIDQLSTLLDQSYRQYLIEGTAGGTSAANQRLAEKRALSVITYLEAQGIKSKNLFVARYDPLKKGRQVYVYSITH